MRSVVRLLFAFLFAAMPCATAYAQTAAAISGTVRDQRGAPVSGASVVLTGAAKAQTTTDAAGTFSFTGLPSGSYSIAITKGGFTPFGIDNVQPGGSSLVIALAPVSLSSVQEIAHVVSNANSVFNSTSAAQTTVSSQQLQMAGPSEVNHLIDEIPGVVSARSTGMNAAVPGALTSPNMRGALDYEKATLVDGHSMINGTRGDYPIMFVQGFLLDNVEVQLGPSAASPEINYAIGGTLNFRTAEPSPVTSGDALFGFDGYGGNYANLRYSGTTANGKLGFVFDWANYGTPGPLNNYGANVAIPSGATIVGYGTVGATTSGKPLNGATGRYPIPGAVVGSPSNAYISLFACCQPVNSNFLENGELAKLRYAFSPTTSAMVAYYGLQAAYNSTASSFAQLYSTFAPGKSYSAAASGGPAFDSSLLLNNTTQIPARNLLDNEPTLEAELRTAYHNDDIIGRFFGAALDRYTVNPLSNPEASYTSTPMTLYGTATIGGKTVTFNGQSAAVTIPNAYSNATENDQLRGEEFQWLHPMGASILSLTMDRTTYLTNSVTVTGNSKNPNGNVSVLAPAGSRQDFTTYVARGIFQIGDRTELTLADYYNAYRSTYSTAVTNGAYQFQTTTRVHNDPRLGLAYHAAPNLSFRFEAGSAVAPPYSALLDVLNQTPAQVYTPGATTITIAQNAGGLLPETSFGYNLGADWRWHDGSVLSVDTYLENLHNQFVTAITPDGTYTPPGSATAVPVYISSNVNLANARFEGVDASISKDPAVGAGYRFTAALQRAYPYNIPASFYSTAAGSYVTNLGVLPGVNYYGFNSPFFSGISNKSEAYSQGYAQFHIRGRNGQYFQVADTLYGSNNTYNVQAFAVMSAVYSLNLTRSLAFQIYGDNLLNTFTNSYITYPAGIGAPLVNGQTGLRAAIPYGPRVVHIQIDHRF